MKESSKVHFCHIKYKKTSAKKRVGEKREPGGNKSNEEVKQ